MPPATPSAPAERFASVIEGLRRAVTARSFRRALAGPLIILIWSRLRRLGVRFARLAARIEAGTLPAAPRRRPAAPRPARPAPPRLPPRLPRGFAWLVQLVPQASAYGSQLQYLLAEPEMAALLEAAPQMGRILRPLCRMLGVRPPPGLRAMPPAQPAAPARPTATGRAPPVAAPPAPLLRPPRASPAPAPIRCRTARGPPVPA